MVRACYLCAGTTFATRSGTVRDNPALKVLECSSCGLVTLSAHDHVSEGHYESSKMYGAEPPGIEPWLKQTESDDRRRFEALRPLLVNRRILDVGCGVGGFLRLARTVAADVSGVEPEARVHEHWAKDLRLHKSLDEADGKYDVISAFHVLEHIADPRGFLRQIRSRLAEGGRAVIEVPNADDVLLTLYKVQAFEQFTYWSQHLFLFTAATLAAVGRQAGFRIVAVRQLQRYPLSNHLHWMARGKPGGHARWAFLDTPELTAAYAATLAASGACDTLIAHLEAAGPGDAPEMRT